MQPNISRSLFCYILILYISKYIHISSTKAKLNLYIYYMFASRLKWSDDEWRLSLLSVWCNMGSVDFWKVEKFKAPTNKWTLYFVAVIIICLRHFVSWRWNVCQIKKLDIFSELHFFVIASTNNKHSALVKISVGASVTALCDSSFVSKGGNTF